MMSQKGTEEIKCRVVCFVLLETQYILLRKLD